MQPTLDNFFKKFRKNKEMIAHVKANSDMFFLLLRGSLSLNYDKNWRCAMLIGHLIKKKDFRLITYIDDFIEVLRDTKIDGHQRQVLVILDKMHFTEDQEGKLFDVCLTIWESVNKIPSTRMRAFWMMEKIAKNYPELQKEMKHFTVDYFIKTLSPGIKHYFVKNYHNTDTEA